MPWRPMSPQDLDRVQVLADAIHVSHPEDMQVFAERLRLHPQGCHVLAEPEGSTGYAISHPWRLNEPPSLNSLLGELPRAATTYYIHDIALLPEMRGRGLASRITESLATHARQAGFDNVSLVAVNKSQAFWERLGFRRSAVPGLEKKLLSYGADAVLMVRNLAGEAI